MENSMNSSSTINPEDLFVKILYPIIDQKTGVLHFLFPAISNI